MDGKGFAIFMLLFALNLFLIFYTPLYRVIYVDEGQYLLVAKKMIDGWVPYRDIIENKPLGAYISLFPAVLLCGTDIVKLRVYTAFMATLAAFLTYLIGKKVGNWRVGLFAAGITTVINAFPGIGGYILYTDSVANLFILGMFYCLLYLQLDYNAIFLIGMLFTAACSIRQSCIFMILPVIYHLYQHRKKLKVVRSMGMFIAGIGIVIVPMLLYLFINSAIHDAFYWIFISPVKVIPRSFDILGRIQDLVILSILFLPFLLLAISGLGGMKKRYTIVLIWLLSGLANAEAGYAWPHNYIFIVPPLSIFASIGIENIINLKNSIKDPVRSNIFAVVLLIVCITALFYIICEFGSASIEWYTPLENQKGIADYINKNTQKEDKIFMFGMNSELYYLSGRDPATRMSFFWGYTCVMGKEEEDEFIFNPLKNVRPKYFLVNDPKTMDLCKNESNIETGVLEYVNANYVYVNTWGFTDLYERINKSVA